MDISKKFERIFNWSLTKDQVESRLGPISDKEFDHFCKTFEIVFFDYYQNTLDVLVKIGKNLKKMNNLIMDLSGSLFCRILYTIIKNIKI